MQAQIEITYEGITVNISGQVILEQLGIDEENWLLDLGSLGGWCALFLVMSIATMVAGVR